MVADVSHSFSPSLGNSGAPTVCRALCQALGPQREIKCTFSTQNDGTLRSRSLGVGRVPGKTLWEEVIYNLNLKEWVDFLRAEIWIARLRDLEAYS